MKYRKTILVVSITVFFSIITSFAYMQGSSDSRLRLTIGSEKKVFKLGEPVQLFTKLENVTKNTIALLDVFGTQTGNLKFEISQNGKDYVGFNSPGWNEIDVVAKSTLQPGEYRDTSAQVLWMWQKQDVPGFMLTKSGDYFVRCRYSAWIEGEKEPTKIVSESIKITIEEPVGEDLEVWDKIKGDGNIAYFILEGELRIPSYKMDERTKFLNEIGTLLNDHPNTFYAQPLRQSLEKFRVNEARRQETLRKMQKPTQ